MPKAAPKPKSVDKAPIGVEKRFYGLQNYVFENHSYRKN